MNKFLFRQILNQWRSNIWIVTELLVVSVVLWYIVDSLYVTYQRVNQPFIHDTEHCYLIEVSSIDTTSPYYKPGAGHDNILNMTTLLNHIKHRPEVEAASMVYNGMYPYSDYSTYNGTGYFDDNDSLIYHRSIYQQLTTSQYPLVFRINGVNGETPEELAAVLKDNNIIFSENAYYDDSIKPKQFINKRVFNGRTATLGAIVQPMRKHTYSYPEEWSIFNINVVNGYGNEIAFRVRPDMDKDIIPSLLADVNKYISGNLIIRSVKSFKDIKRNAEIEYTNETRNFVVIAIFLMVNIFLGLLGTFWFRTQQRTSEVAVRRAIGSSTGEILCRVISEGILLLSIATIPSIGIDIALSHFQLTSDWGGFISWHRTGLCILITYAIMALMIVLGTLPPAIKAMRIKPAIALKDE